MTRFQRHQRRQITKHESAPELRTRHAGFRLADRHPFEISLKGGVAARNPVAFGFVRMVLRAANPRIVCAFMIIPKAQERVGRMHGERSGVALILRMALSVIVKRDDFMRRFVLAADDFRRLAAPFIRAIFVNIITRMQNEVDGVVFGDRIIGVEIAELEIGTGNKRNAEFVHGADGQGACAARGGCVAV